MKKILFILVLSFTFLQTAYAIETTESHGLPLNAQGGVGSGFSGMRIESLANMTLTNITKSPLTNGNNLYIYNDSGALMISKQFSSDIATFNQGEINLTAGSKYRIVTTGGGSWTHACLGSDPGFPITGQYFSWLNGLFPNQNTIENWVYFCNIESIGFSTDYFPPSPPILSPIGNQTAPENQTLTIQLQATDPNLNDTLTFLTNAQTTLPSASFLNSTSGLFTWTPNFNEQGFYQTTFYVTDGQFIDYETINIQVIDINFATITLTGNASVGNNLILNINDPQNANKPYILSAAFGSSPGIPLIDGRIIPLNEDWLFNAVLYVPSLFGFSNSIGSLDSQGNAQVIWSIPNLPFFQNANISFSFATLNHNEQGLRVIQSIAPAVNITIQ